jgi:hypothetical protein
MSRVRVEVQTARTWPRAVPSQQHTGASDVADFPFDIGPSLSKVARSADTRAAYVPIISNERASSTRSLLANALVIVASSVFAGTAYESVVGQDYHDINDFLRTGLLIAVIFCGALRLFEERQPMKISHVYGRARHAFVAWLTTFAVFLAIAFTLKLGDELSRGAILSTFLLGLVAVPLSHMHLPLLLERIRKPGAFMHRDAIVIGARGDASFTDTLRRTSWSSMQVAAAPSGHPRERRWSTGFSRWRTDSDRGKSILHFLRSRIREPKVFCGPCRWSPVRFWRSRTNSPVSFFAMD